MANTYRFEIVTPSGVVFSDEVEHVRAPGVLGSFGVLPGHTPFITPLDVGEINVRTGGEELVFATSGGLADVHAGSFLILAETCEKADMIDIDRAKSARERALQRLKEAAEKREIDRRRAREALMRADNRLRIAAKL